jgi:manganese efflux pump family protein
MNLFELILLSVAVSLGVFKVAMEAAVEYCFDAMERLKIATIFAFSKAALMFLGFWITSLFAQMVWEMRYTLIVSIFMVLGIKIIFESFKVKGGERSYDLKNVWVLTFTSIAVNIDGMIAGIAFAFAEVQIVTLILLMFLSTFVSASAGLVYGKNIGRFKSASFTGMAGGFILVAYALYVLFDKLGGFI